MQSRCDHCAFTEASFIAKRKRLGAQLATPMPAKDYCLMLYTWRLPMSLMATLPDVTANGRRRER